MNINRISNQEKGEQTLLQFLLVMEMSVFGDSFWCSLILI